jgi:indolepyruvate ferredoxin oxidoreductase beta subunit
MSAAEHASPRLPGWRILIAGTGGQGVITAARLLTEFSVQNGHQVLSSQLHGMAQRGGAVQSTVLIDCGISPAMGLGEADIVLGLEPIETARALPFISSKTAVIMNTIPVIPCVLAQNFVLGEGPSEYPSVEKLSSSIREVTAKLATLDATALAKQAGSLKSLNVVMLGCLLGSELLPYSAEHFLQSVMKTAPSQLSKINSKAFLSGIEFGKTLSWVEESKCH